MDTMYLKTFCRSKGDNVSIFHKVLLSYSGNSLQSLLQSRNLSHKAKQGMFTFKLLLCYNILKTVSQRIEKSHINFLCTYDARET